MPEMKLHWLYGTASMLTPGQVWVHPTGGQVLIVEGLGKDGQIGEPHAVTLSGPDAEVSYPFLTRWTGTELCRELLRQEFTLDPAARLIVRRGAQ